MAIYRNISTTFWTDSKVADDFTADDKYIYLYLFTNPHSNLCGCYEVSYKQIAYEAGISVDKAKKLIDRLQNEFDVIRYDGKTKEVLILNWHKYNWTKSEKFRKPLLKEIEKVKSPSFREYLFKAYNGELDTVSANGRYPIDTVSEIEDTVSAEEIHEEYPIDTTVTVTVTDTVSVTDTDTVTESETDTETVKEIVDYLNEMCGTKYKASSEKTRKLIRARLNDGFTVEDFRTVIFKKARDWINDPKMCKFLRPETLFSNKFEGYLNEKTALSSVERWDYA